MQPLRPLGVQHAIGLFVFRLEYGNDFLFLMTKYISLYKFIYDYDLSQDTLCNLILYNMWTSFLIPVQFWHFPKLSDKMNTIFFISIFKYGFNLKNKTLS